MRFTTILLALVGIVAVKGDGKLEKSCNGRPEFCDWRYSNVTFVGSHHSALSGRGRFDFQDKNLTEQLDMGVRVLHMDIVMMEYQVHACRPGYCDVYNTAGFAAPMFKEIKQWMDRNDTRTEVVTLLIDSYEVPFKWIKNIFETTGLDKHAFDRNAGKTFPWVRREGPSLEEWPTLGELCETGKRLVTFMTNSNMNEAPYLLETDTYLWSTPESRTKLTGLYDCSVARPASLDTQGLMSVVHHSTYRTLANGFRWPDVNMLKYVKERDPVHVHTHRCSTLQDGRKNNFVLFDLVDKQDTNDTYLYLNGYGSRPSKLRAGGWGS